jgi:hypothetical protein
VPPGGRSKAASNILEARIVLLDAEVTVRDRNEIIRSFELESFRVQRTSVGSTAYRLFDDTSAALPGRYASTDSRIAKIVI